MQEEETREYGERGPQPHNQTVINWAGLYEAENQQLVPILSITDNWILLSHPLGKSNKTLPPLREAK